MLEKEAKRLRDFSIGRYWLFVYEILDETELYDDWKIMKKSDISFLEEWVR